MEADLVARPGWRINPLRRCYERGSERRPMRIYPGPDGFAVSAFDVWVEGLHPEFSAAEEVALREGCEPEAGSTARAAADAADLKRARRCARRTAR